MNILQDSQQDSQRSILMQIFKDLARFFTRDVNALNTLTNLMNCLTGA